MLTNGRLRAIAGAPNNANVIYTGGDDGQVWMTTNGGASWRQINANLPNRSISDIAVHPTNPYKVYVVLGGTGTPHVYRCDNTLANTPVWVNISGSGLTGLPDVHTNSIALDPAAPRYRNLCGQRCRLFLHAGRRRDLAQRHATAGAAECAGQHRARCARHRLPDGGDLRARDVAHPPTAYAHRRCERRRFAWTTATSYSCCSTSARTTLKQT
jgi:hypothetical protein